MRDILDSLIEWSDRDMPYAVATVVETWSSAPRPAGASMAVNAEGEVVGSISGGCVESAVVELCSTALGTNTVQREVFGVSGADAFAIGLTCGGTIEVCVYPADHGFGDRLRDVREALRAGAPAVLQTPAFTHRFDTAPHMIVCGAIDFAEAMTRVGKLLGYHVVLCDARATFATPARFPHADEIVVDWPHRYLRSRPVAPSTVLCVLTHDPKFDIPLLEWALRQPFAYIGAMGSRRTCADRESQLRLRGLGDEHLARLHAPIGLDIGGRTPAETAVAIAAEIIGARENRAGTPLRSGTAAIHSPGAEMAVGCPE